MYFVFLENCFLFLCNLFSELVAWGTSRKFYVYCSQAGIRLPPLQFRELFSLFPSVCLSVCLSVHLFVLFIRLSVFCLFVCLPVCVFVYLSVCLLVCLFACLFACLFVYVFVCLFICPFSNYVSYCLFVYHSVFVCVSTCLYFSLSF